MDSYQAVFARKEIKYLLSQPQLEGLMPRLEEHMEPDVFAHSSISNLYYDTPDFQMIRRSLEKPQYKEKLRLRCYGPAAGDSPVFPEIKKKALGIVYKRRVSMTYEQALAYLSGEIQAPEGQIFRELDWMLGSYPHLAPRVYLSYERDSWRGKEDPSLRLTLDRDILWRSQDLDLRQPPRGEALLLPQQLLMEVKAPGALPLWLTEALSVLGIFPVSFSKYGRAYQSLFNEKFKTMEMKRYA